MFDTKKVAESIKTARNKKNMTQMDLADQMGVSYQAVSNWERGNSMPDISRLQELCNILDISLEELVGEKDKQTEIVGKLMANEEEDVSLDDIAEVAPILKPTLIENKIDDAISNNKKISSETLLELAPFMDNDSLDKLARKMADTNINMLCNLAPFLKKDTLDAYVEKWISEEKTDFDSIEDLAPFLSKSAIKELVGYMISHDCEEEIVRIAPFMGKDGWSFILDKESI